METYSFRSFIESKYLNREIIVKHQPNVEDKIKTLTTQKIIEIDNKLKRAKKSSLTVFNVDGVEYYFIVYIEDPLSKLKVSIDFYTIDKQYWEVDKEICVKPIISNSTVISSNPKNWGLAMMILQIAKWGELKNDFELQRNYYAYALWLLNDYFPTDFQSNFKDEILNHPSISYLSWFKDFALEELKFCEVLWKHCPEFKSYQNSNFIWFFLQYSYFISMRRPLTIPSKDYLTFLKENAKSYKRLINKKRIRPYQRDRDKVYQDEFADEYECKDIRYFFRFYLLTEAYNHIYITSRVKPNPYCDIQ